MKYHLKTKITLYLILLAFLSILVTSIATNVFLEREFKGYISEKISIENQQLINIITGYYSEYSILDKSVIEFIGMNALDEGMILKVKDASGHVVWDAMTHDKKKCQEILDHITHNMTSRYPNWADGPIKIEYPLLSGNELIGTIEIVNAGSYFLNDHDLHFINTLNKIFAVVAIGSLIGSIILGVMIAKKLDRPLQNVIKAANHIANGDYENRIEEKYDMVEIENLTNSINTLAESLGKQEMLRKQLTVDVAHELRTPLTTLQGNMEAMIDGIWPMDAERLQSCHEEIIRLAGLVKDLEKLAVYESDSNISSVVQVDLYDLLQRITCNFQSLFSNKNISLELTGNGVVILAEKNRVNQLFINLISNALAYTPSGGSVVVDIDKVEMIARVSVRDTGIGISDKDLPHIFERFYRVDKSRNRNSGGSGIGLAIVKAIVDAHKGKIEVKSKKGEGTEVIVELPGVVK